MPHSRRSGRPPRVSRAMLQESAFELFLEQGYAATTVEQIAHRAGVSRATFFNHFSSKGDVLWVELDDAASRLALSLEDTTRRADRAPAIDEAVGSLLAVAEEFPSDRVPFVLTQHELIGSAHEIQASALTRLAELARLLEDHLVERALSRDRARLTAYTLLGAVIAATRSWADAGTARGSLAPHLTRTLTPLARALDAS